MTGQIIQRQLHSFSFLLILPAFFWLTMFSKSPVFSTCSSLAGSGTGSPGLPAVSADSIVKASGIKGGLAIVTGCDNPLFLSELAEAGPYLVNGLDSDPGKVTAARKVILGKNIYGRVTVSLLKNTRLPFADNLVNLIIITRRSRIPDRELNRILSPGGVIADISNSRIEITRKDRPAELDEWTHFLHDASNNAVSKDMAVGPPRGLRWTCGPKFARSHEHLASMSAMVSSGGRIFYIIDEGPISSVFLPSQWNLVARDAFSGVLLWKKPITNWESRLRGFRSGPPEIGRRIVAAGDQVYVTLGYGEPVTVLEGSTGKKLSILASTGGAREMVLADGVLYVLADDMTASRHNIRKNLINRISLPLKTWYLFPRKEIPMYGIQRILAIKTGTGRLLWKQRFKAPGEIMPTTLAAANGRVCIHTVSDVICFDGLSGRELWRSPHPVACSRLSWSTPTLVISKDVVLTFDRIAKGNTDNSSPAHGSKWLISSGGSIKKQDAELTAFSLVDGTKLWSAPGSENYNTPGDIFVIKAVVWTGDLRRRIDSGFTQGRDLETGRVIATLPPQKAWGHHRCYRNKATLKWIMTGRGGIQFVDIKKGTCSNVPWTRGSCQYGIMPANGLLYVPQHSCACNPNELLTGLNALSPMSSRIKGSEPLEKGPAYDEISKSKSMFPKNSTSGAGKQNVNTSSVSTSEAGKRNVNTSPASRSCSKQWPTYRRDARRSGFQDLPAPVKPGIRWTRKFFAPITAPVAAGGIAVVAETERHTVHALSETDGKPAWTFTADGRIDSPPTLFNGLCLFGTRNGFVYCLRASNGKSVWRFRAAPCDRRLFACGQLESAWPVHGSLLVDDKLSNGVPVVYFAAGRSTFLDGGIMVYALDLKTGRVLHQINLNTTRDNRERKNNNKNNDNGFDYGRNRIRLAVLPDILSLQENTIWMRGLGLDRNLSPVEKRSHLFAPRGFLDTTWWHRTYWIYGTKTGGGYSNWPLAGNALPSGRLLVFDGGELIYGYGRMSYRVGYGHVQPDMTKSYKLFEEVLRPYPEITKSQVPKRRIKWTAQLPFVARAIVLVRDALLVSGGGLHDENSAQHGPGIFWTVSREDGSRKTSCALPAPPVFDGMIMTGRGILISAVDGSLIHL